MPRTKIIELDGEEIQRFWSKVDKDGPNGCWVWTAFCNPKGYGQYWRNTVTSYLAHRVSHFLATGDQAVGIQVHHNCPDGKDNPSCVNPEHLSSGTDRTNMDRRNSLGRTARGERSGTSKLTEEDVQQILEDDTHTGRYLARKFNVSHTAIYDIFKCITWRHIERPPGTNRKRRPYARA